MVVHYYGGGPRVLSSNHSTQCPRAVVVFDTETHRTPHPSIPDVWQHKLRLGWGTWAQLKGSVVERQEWLEFKSPAVFWEWTCSKFSGRWVVWVFAHNLAFDLEVVEFRKLLGDGVFHLYRPQKTGGPVALRGACRKRDMGLLIFGDPPTILKIWHASGRSVYFLDTLNYYRQSLASIGQGVGLEKLPMPAWEAPDSEWSVYCKRDVEVTLAAVLSWIRAVNEEHLGRFALTVAGQSHNAFRHSFMKHKIVIHSDLDCQHHEHAGLYGGQTEVYYVGRTPPGRVTELDVSALYPYVCAAHDLPCQLLEYYPQCPAGWSPRFGWGSAIAEVHIHSENRGYPVRLPRGIAYAVGDYWTTLAGPELVAALEAGHVRRIRRVSSYWLQPIAREYMEACWARRLECERSGDSSRGLVWKLLANSFWGKFCQRDHRWVPAPLYIPPCEWGVWIDSHPFTGEPVAYRSLGGIVEYRDDEGWAKNSFLAIGAFVTANARETMRRYREIAGPRHVYHQAVDSLHVDEVGRTRLEAAGCTADREWGKLRVKRVADRAEFWGQNVWSMAEKTVRGPIKERAVEVAPRSYQEVQFERLKGMLRRVPDGTVQERTLLLSLTPTIGLRTTGPDGWTLPCELTLTDQ